MKLFKTKDKRAYTMLNLITIFVEVMLIFSIGFSLGRSYERSIPKETKVIFQEIPTKRDPAIQDINDEKNEYIMRNYCIEEPEVDRAIKEPVDPKSQYIKLINMVCDDYTFYPDLPYLIQAIMEVESNYQPYSTSSASCVGLMQISTYWQRDRIEKLGVTDIFDPYYNILIGVDFLNDLYYNYANKDIWLAVMMYNMDFNSARRIRASGELTDYAIKVRSIFEDLKGGRDAQGKVSSGSNG